jgi:hypothetical protein
VKQNTNTAQSVRFVCISDVSTQSPSHSIRFIPASAEHYFGTFRCRVLRITLETIFL